MLTDCTTKPPQGRTTLKEQLQSHFPSETPSSSWLARKVGWAPGAQPVQASPFSPAVLQAVCRINRAIQKGVAADTVKELTCPEAQLPPVYPSASAVYQQELTALQQQRGGVSPRSRGEPRTVSAEHPQRDPDSCREGEVDVVRDRGLQTREWKDQSWD